jgi:hypothetical protein
MHFVPRWVLRQSFLEKGVCLGEKLPHWEPPKYIPAPRRVSDDMELTEYPVSDFRPRNRRRKGFRGMGSKPKVFASNKDLVVEGGGFQDWEYRFYTPFIDDKSDSFIGASCRGCEQYVQGTKENRRTHSKNEGCFKMLIAAYSALLRDAVCCVCDTRTFHRKYGVPICNTQDCLQLFKHEHIQTDAMKFALELVRATARREYAEWTTKQIEIKKEMEARNGLTS